MNNLSAISKSYLGNNLVAYYSLIPLIISSFSYGNNDIYQYIFRVGGIFSFFIMLSTARVVLNRQYLFRVYISPIASAIFLYTIVSAYSSSLSLNPLLGYWKSLEVFCVFLYLLFIANTRQANEDNNILYIDIFKKVVATMLLISIVLKFIITGGVVGKISGYFPIINPNSIGSLSLILSLIFLYNKNTLLGVLFFLIMVFSGSKTALGVFLLLFIAFIFLYKKQGYSKGVTGLLGLVAFSSIIIFFYPVYEGAYLSGVDLTRLSGRVHLWESVDALDGGDYFFSKIFHGNGISVSSRYLYLISDEINSSISMHNSWLEMVLASGFIISLYIFGIILYSGKILFFYAKNRLNIVLFFIFIVVLIRSFTSSNISSIQPEMILFYIISQYAFILNRRSKRIPKR